MNTLADFLDNAKRKSICERGAKMWENCKSKKSLIDLALSAFGCEYVANAINEGWGISPEVIAEEFSMFNNGKYTREKEGYTSQLYCLPDTDEITISSTLTLIIGFKKLVIIPEHRFCELHICDSEVSIYGKGRAEVYLYNSVIRNKDTAPIHIKEIKNTK